MCGHVCECLRERNKEREEREREREERERARGEIKLDIRIIVTQKCAWEREIEYEIYIISQKNES